jgi:asparagine synthetase B (glutamine-hydrolysing)
MEAASMQLEALLLESVRRRVDGPSLTGVSVLFSGGVDSAVLAALALRVLDDATPLYLVNVEFVDDREDEALRTTQAADTLSAQSSYAELMRIFPTHSVHFVRERIAWTDIQERQTHIHSLVSPKSSVMDLNIGAALWFASRAAPTRVILTGLGADEQLGGYGRHRKAWESGGGGFHAAHSLRQELQRDQDRLWDRNLGRDDRVMSDHGKEARYPYLDDCVVAYLRSLPPDLICDYSLPPGQGDKRILRLLAERLGCTCASATVKRAIQFGSRMAHVCDKQRFGSRRKATGEATLVVLS